MEGTRREPAPPWQAAPSLCRPLHAILARMSVPARRVRTFEELYAEIRALPEGRTAMILEPGELTVMPRPHARHQRVMKGPLRALGAIDADGDGDGWWILAEVEVRFGERLLVPDLSGYRVANVPELPEENPLPIAPEWTCEILSPSSAGRRPEAPALRPRGRRVDVDRRPGGAEHRVLREREWSAQVGGRRGRRRHRSPAALRSAHRGGAALGQDREGVTLRS